MSVATLDDVIEEICNALGIYGAHHDECDLSGRLRGMCRCCASSYLRAEIERAVKVERKLAAQWTTPNPNAAPASAEE